MTIKEASEQLNSGKITSVELTKQYLANASRLEPLIHAFISVLDKDALKMAEGSDKRRNDGKELSEIDGIPIAIKDNLAMKGTKTTAGSKILENFKPPYETRTRKITLKRFKLGFNLVVTPGYFKIMIRFLLKKYAFLYT